MSGFRVVIRDARTCGSCCNRANQVIGQISEWANIAMAGVQGQSMKCKRFAKHGKRCWGRVTGKKISCHGIHSDRVEIFCHFVSFVLVSCCHVCSKCGVLSADRERGAAAAAARGGYAIQWVAFAGMSPVQLQDCWVRAALFLFRLP